MSLLRATRSKALLLFATMTLAAPFGPDAMAREATDGQGVTQGRDGSLRLSDDAGAAPAAIAEADRFGMWDSTPEHVAQAFNTVHVRYTAEAPTGTEYFVGVRASADGNRWSEWKWDVANNSVVAFEGTHRWLQQRVVLLGSTDSTPTVGRIMLEPQAMSRPSSIVTKAPGDAPTYRLRVTRQGMVGGRTANGYIIKKNDFFVSLPSWSSLSSRNGSEYQVRLSANGKSVVVRVADVGPWNKNDNYWSADRTRYKDLPVGWPQDHAAYFEKHNKGRAEKGYVRYPTAVDIGDGAYWALGLKGAQATVDVTFLWLGNDPGPNPAPINSAPSKRP
jgi:hypothetical protein